MVSGVPILKHFRVHCFKLHVGNISWVNSVIIRGSKFYAQWRHLNDQSLLSSYFYFILFYLITLQQFWGTTDDCNSPSPPCPVFSCPSWAGKVHHCPLFNIVFPPLLLFSPSLHSLKPPARLPQSGKNIWKIEFSPGQGKVREFCGWSGKFRKDLQSQGKVREFENKRLWQADFRKFIYPFQEGKDVLFWG